MVYGETGTYPVYIDICCRIISFWVKLLNPVGLKYSSVLYKVSYSLYRFSGYSMFKWLDNVRNILVTCGLSGIWDSQSFPNAKWLLAAVKQKLIDIFVTKWYSELENSSSAINYRIYKTKFGFENYLVSLPHKFRKTLIQIRTRNHRLPIETGRWQQIDRDERCCHLCRSEIGDEFHYILVCNKLKNVRKLYLPNYCHIRPNVIKFKNLMQSKNISVLRKLSIFLEHIFSSLKDIESVS